MYSMYHQHVQHLGAGLQKSTVVSQVYDYLRRSIVELAIQPGEKVDVRRLSQELHVSQTPIREALQKLTEQGLVVAKPHIGYFAVRLTPKDIEELFDLREALETLALRSALENIEIPQLQELQSKLDRLEDEGLPDEIVIRNTQDFDQEFHVGLVLHGSKSKWLAKYANGILDLVCMTTRLTLNPEAACREHREILQALMRRDLPRATAALRGHLERSKQEAIRALEGGDHLEQRAQGLQRRSCQGSNLESV